MVKILLFRDLQIVVTNAEVVIIILSLDEPIVVTNGELVKILLILDLQIDVTNSTTRSPPPFRKRSSRACETSIPACQSKIKFGFNR
jgi:hypothetical protein